MPRAWFGNDDPDYEICYVTSDIAVFKLKRATCAYRVAVKRSDEWMFVDPDFGRFPMNGYPGALPDFDGSIYYANDALKLANEIRRKGAGDA